MTVDPILKKRFNDWQDLESTIESIESNKQKGDIFEHFAFFFFKFYSSLYQIEEIYCPIVDGRSFPQKILDKLKLERKDHGVDGVYITNQGEYEALLHPCHIMNRRSG